MRVLHFLRRLVLHHLERIAKTTQTVIDDFFLKYWQPRAFCWWSPPACTLAPIF